MNIKTILRFVPMLVALPLLHLLASSLFLYGYVRGFGGGIGSFVSATDIFRISIRDLIGLYILLTPMVAAPIYYYYRPRNEPRRKVSLVFLSVGLGVALFAGILFSLHTWWPQTFDMSMSSDYGFQLLALSYFILLIVFDLFIVRNIKAWVFAGCAFAFISLIAEGAIHGYHDRHTSYFPNAPLVAHCNSVGVLRAFSDLYLAIRRDNVELLIDRDCKGRFVFPRTWTNDQPLTGL